MPSLRHARHRGFSTISWAVTIGVLLAIVVMLVGWWIEPEPTQSRRRHRDLDIKDLVTPDALTQEEITRASTRPEGSAVKLDDGAWVQVADANGRLEQQYSAERINPLPDGWLEMDRPRAMVYLDGGKIVTLRGEQGLVSVPQQAIESGTLEGDVVIRLFVPQNGQPVKIEESDPEVIVRTEQATFDNLLGEIRCKRGIRIDAENASFSGVGLTMLLGEGERSIERLVVEQATGPIRVTRLGEDADSVADEPTPSGGGTVDPDRSVASADQDPQLYYRLELEREVRIERYDSIDDPRPSLALEGERLVSVFSLDGNSLSSDPTSSPAVSTPATTSIGMNRDRLVAASMLAGTTLEQAEPVETDASESDDSDSGVLLIHYVGRLVMTPVPDDQRPEVNGEILVSIQSGEAPVTVHDVDSEAVVGCGELTYRRSDDQLDLLGSERHPLHVTSPQLTLVGERFGLSRQTGAGRIDGPGGMRLTDPGPPTEDGGEPQVGSDLTMKWAGGVDLEFLPGTERLSAALFQKNVEVANDDFDLEAELLDVFFAGGDDDQTDALRRIYARGTDDAPARASRRIEPGLLAARTIDLSLERDEDGRTIPVSLRAEGAVLARDSEQTLWTNGLDVTFASPAESAAADSSPGQLRSVGIDRVIADDGVQVQLADGARVWARSLDGSGLGGRLRLKDDDGGLMIVRGNVIADHLRQLDFDDSTRTAVANGPGRFRYVEDPIVFPADGPLPRPTFDDLIPTMEATWGDRMSFDDVSNEGSGAIELEGDVIVRNRPDDFEENDLDADRLRLDLARRNNPPILDDQGNPPSEDQLTAFSGSRDVRMLTAIGSARLESRTWSDADHRGEPDLFRITGPSVTYDTRSREGMVRGAGQLLVNSVPVVGADTDGAPSTSGPALGSDGTTRFSWGGSMQMSRQVADRYLVTMTEGVEVLHAGLGPKDTLSLTAGELEVLLDRPSGPGEDAVLSNVSSNGDDALDLGGSAEILGVVARGTVFIRTPEQDVECEIFDYEAGNQIARLTAREGRLVTVLTKGSATPVRAEAVTWDMKTGRIQISGAVGGATR